MVLRYKWEAGERIGQIHTKKEKTHNFDQWFAYCDRIRE